MPRSQLVEDQINKLSAKDGCQLKDSKSPTVNKLNTVSKLRQIFENSENQPPNTPKKTSPGQIFKSLNCRKSSSKSPKNQFAGKKIDLIIKELITREHEYITTLENGIKNYVVPITNPSKCSFAMPREIMLQRFKLFGNIQDIHRIHKSTILPELMACENDILKLAQTFINFIENDTLYCYITYVIIHLHAKEMVSSYGNFFKKLQAYCDDRLGVQSFILQPIQKLSRYPLLLEAMIKDLSSDMNENKSSLAALCIAKKKLEKYIHRMNQALKLNDIYETHQLDISFQYLHSLTSLQLEWNEDINSPSFFIVPTISCFSDYRSPINVFDLGRFIAIESFECEEHEPYYSFPGELFLFEKGLLYTKKCDRGDINCLSYRNYFKFGPSTSLDMETLHKRFTMGDTRYNRIVSFTATTNEKVFQFYEQVKCYHDQRRSDEDSMYSSELSRSRSIRSYKARRSLEIHNQEVTDNEAATSKENTSYEQYVSIGNDSSAKENVSCETVPGNPEWVNCYESSELDTSEEFERIHRHSMIRDE